MAREGTHHAIASPVVSRLHRSSFSNPAVLHKLPRPGGRHTFCSTRAFAKCRTVCCPAPTAVPSINSSAGSNALSTLSYSAALFRNDSKTPGVACTRRAETCLAGSERTPLLCAAHLRLYCWQRSRGSTTPDQPQYLHACVEVSCQRARAESSKFQPLVES